MNRKHTGFTACELRQNLMNTEFRDLVEYSLTDALLHAIVGKGVANLTQSLDRAKGFFHGDGLEEAIDRTLAEKRCQVALGMTLKDVMSDSVRLLGPEGKCTQFRGTTFADLKLFKPENKLVISGFDISNGTLVYFSFETTPNLRISKAVRASSSVPIVFAPVVHDGHLYVDGGVLRRVPVDAFPSSAPERSIAFLLSGDYEPTKPGDLRDVSFATYSTRIMRAMLKMTQDLDIVQKMKKHDMEVVQFGTWPNVSRVSPMNFHLSQEEKFAMMHTGYVATRDMLVNRRKCGDIVKESPCASPSCFGQSGADSNGASCGWLAHTYAELTVGQVTLLSLSLYPHPLSPAHFYQQ